MLRIGASCAVSLLATRRASDRIHSRALREHPRAAVRISSATETI